MAEIRLLPLEFADGPRNMAADEVLLESAVVGTASLRFYGWSEASLSLGYFQPAAARLAHPSIADLPFVRRPTGGQNLVHHHELTYALALPTGLPWQGAESWLCRMHQVIADAFHSLGVSLTFVEKEQRDPGAILCFRQWSAADLLCGQAKVVGSAQRKHRQALLQHGGILLAASPHAPSLSGIQEKSGLSLPPEQVRTSIVQTFNKATGWSVVEKAWTEEERGRIQELVVDKYGTRKWNEKR